VPARCGRAHSLGSRAGRPQPLPPGGGRGGLDAGRRPGGRDHRRHAPAGGGRRPAIIGRSPCGMPRAPLAWRPEAPTRPPAGGRWRAAWRRGQGCRRVPGQHGGELAQRGVPRTGGATAAARGGDAGSGARGPRAAGEAPIAGAGPLRGGPPVRPATDICRVERTWRIRAAAKAAGSRGYRPEEPPRSPGQSEVRVTAYARDEPGGSEALPARAAEGIPLPDRGATTDPRRFGQTRRAGAPAGRGRDVARQRHLLQGSGQADGDVSPRREPDRVPRVELDQQGSDTRAPGAHASGQLTPHSRRGRRGS